MDNSDDIHIIMKEFYERDIEVVTHSEFDDDSNGAYITIELDPEFQYECKRRLGLTDEEFEHVINITITKNLEEIVKKNKGSE